MITSIMPNIYDRRNVPFQNHTIKNGSTAFGEMVLATIMCHHWWWYFLWCICTGSSIMLDDDTEVGT